MLHGSLFVCNALHARYSAPGDSFRSATPKGREKRQVVSFLQEIGVVKACLVM